VTEEDEEQDADCLHSTGRFSEDRTGEYRIECAKCFREAHTLCAGMEEDFFLSLVRDKRCFVHSSLYLCICDFHIL
jgi:hypothetical protein